MHLSTRHIVVLILVVASRPDNTLAEYTFMKNSKHWLEYNSKLLSSYNKQVHQENSLQSGLSLMILHFKYEENSTTKLS